MGEKWNVKFLKILGTVQAVLRRNWLALTAYVKKGLSNNLSFHLRLEKKKQSKTTSSRMKEKEESRNQWNWEQKQMKPKAVFLKDQ